MYMSQMTVCLLIFLFMAVAFFTNKIPMCFTSMIVLLLLVFTGCVDGKEAIATFGSSTVITMVSMYIVAAGLSRTQMIKKISGTLLKVTNGSFTKILATYIIATCILGQFVPSLVATFAMVTPLVLNVCDQMHISPTKMIFPIAVAVVGVSFVIIPIGPYAADYVMYNGYLESYGWTQTAFTIWTDTPALFINGVITALVCIFVLPKFLPDEPEIQTEALNRRKKADPEPLSPIREFLGYGVFIAVIIGLMVGLPSWQVSMVGAVVLVATGVLTADEAIDNMGMDTILLYVGVVVLGNALSATGAADMLGGAFASLLGHTSNRYLIGAAFYVAAFIMTSVLYNRAVTMVLYPLAIMTCVTMGVDPRGPMILCSIASMSSLITPMATAIVPMAMTTGGYSSKTVFKVGLIPAVVRGIVSTLVVMTMFPI